MRLSTGFKTVMTAAVMATAIAACGGPTAPPAADAPTPPPSPAAAPSAEPVLLEVRDAAGVQLSGNAQAGARVFRAVCGSCHSVAAGMNGTGPSLHGVIGRTAGTVPGFTYSEANRTSAITWTEQELFTYLERPSARIPNTTMVFQGVRQPQQRADLIAYLRTESD